MDINSIRTALHEQPFREFVLCLADGRRILVKQPEFVAMNQRIVIVTDEESNTRILEPLLIVSLEHLAGNENGNGKRKRKPQVSTRLSFKLPAPEHDRSRPLRVAADRAVHDNHPGLVVKSVREAGFRTQHALRITCADLSTQCHGTNRITASANSGSPFNPAETRTMIPSEDSMRNSPNRFK